MSELVPRVIEAKGKSIDEAIENGLRTLGVSIDEVLIETVQAGTKGIFGIGSKPCIVKLTQKDLDFSYADLEIKEKLIQKSVPLQEPAHALEKKQRTVSVEQAPVKANQMKTGQGNSRQNKPAPLKNNRYDSVQQDRTPYVDYLKGESDCEAAAFIEETLKRMDIKSTLKYYKTDSVQKIKIESDAMGVLIGHRGETLDALQYLTSLVVNKGRENYSRITIDTENYRLKREETLVRLARKLASQVKSTGRKIELEPMNPYERRVLHATLQNNPFVETHSVGDEPNRHVVITARRNKKD